MSIRTCTFIKSLSETYYNPMNLCHYTVKCSLLSTALVPGDSWKMSSHHAAFQLAAGCGMLVSAFLFVNMEMHVLVINLGWELINIL